MVSLGFGTEAIQISIFLGLTVGILLVSFTLAGFMCRRKFGPVRFCIWMGVWVLLTTIGFFAVFGIIQSVMYGMSMSMMIMQILMVALIYGGILVIGLLPFEILWFKNAFWRKRFDAVFGLKTRAVVQIDLPSEVEASAVE